MIWQYHYYKENDFFHRGDIIVFQKDDVQFVKRVIGLLREKVKPNDFKAKVGMKACGIV
ncbi:S26 family signal peptidase [Paenibacillus sp. NPDC055715]